METNLTLSLPWSESAFKRRRLAVNWVRGRSCYSCRRWGLETAVTFVWLHKVSRASLLAAGVSLVSQLRIGREAFPIQVKGEVAEGKLCVSVLNPSTPFLESCLRSFVVAGALMWCKKFFLGFQAQQPIFHGGLLQWSMCHFGKPCLIHVSTRGGRDWLSESKEKRRDC